MLVIYQLIWPRDLWLFNSPIVDVAEESPMSWILLLFVKPRLVFMRRKVGWGGNVSVCGDSFVLIQFPSSAKSRQKCQSIKLLKTKNKKLFSKYNEVKEKKKIEIKSKLIFRFLFHWFQDINEQNEWLQ